MPNDNLPPMRDLLRYLNVRVTERRLISQRHKSTIQNIAAAYEYKTIDEEDFEALMQDITEKQNRLFDGDVAISRRRERVLEEVHNIVVRAAGASESEIDMELSQYLNNLQRIPTPKNRGEENEYLLRLCKFYQVLSHSRQDIWCPISKHWSDHRDTQAVHVVPSRLIHETIAHLFGDNGYDLLWSVGNGILMRREFARAFANYEFCLLPIIEDGKPDEFRVFLMNEEIRNDLVFYLCDKTRGDYDGTILQFSEDSGARPSRRFLYFHYCMCMIKAQRDMTPGWQNLRQKMGGLWTIPGEFVHTRQPYERGLADSGLPFSVLWPISILFSVSLFCSFFHSV